MHPTIIAESFIRASAKSVEYLTDISTPVDLKDKASLLRAASTSLNSKVTHYIPRSSQPESYHRANSAQIVSQYSSLLAPIAVSAVTRLITPTSANVDLRDIRIVKKVGGTIEDTELVEGVVLNQNVVVTAGGPTRMEKAKIALVQFQLSAPKPDVSSCGSRSGKRRVDRVPFADGQYCRGERLSSDGQDSQRGATIPTQHVQED